MTDYDSRLMRTTGGNWGQTYNAQAVVDAKAQVVVACTVTNDVNDGRQLAPMFRQTIANTGRKPDVGLGDKGYFSGAALQDPELRGIKLLVPPPIEKELKIRHGRRAFLPSDEMKTLLAEPENKRLYGLRQITVEPVFGQIKAAMKFRKFSLRGLGAVSNEWSLVCAAHNLLKVFRSGWCLS